MEYCIPKKVCAKTRYQYNMIFNKNRTLDPLEGRGGYSTVSIPAGPIAPIGTQWHVFYLPLSLNTKLVVLKNFSTNLIWRDGHFKEALK
jgi:hypothetical protein